MSLCFILFYYVNWKPNGEGALIDGCVPCISGITTLNKPLAAETRVSPLWQNKLWETRAQWAITDGSQHYHVPYNETIMNPDIHPNRSSPPPSLPHPHVIFIIFKLHSVSGIRTVYGTYNTIVGHEFCW